MYFIDKRLKDILFPTLIVCTYQNDRSIAILDQEMDIMMLIKYLKQNELEELPIIREMDKESDHTAGASGAFGGGPRGRSPQSISSDRKSVV